jgi:hypothetical protein
MVVGYLLLRVVATVTLRGELWKKEKRGMEDERRRLEENGWQCRGAQFQTYNGTVDDRVEALFLEVLENGRVVVPDVLHGVTSQNEERDLEHRRNTRGKGM